MLAPLLQAFFTERLARQRDASPHTIASYRDSFRLLLTFLNEQTGKTPSKLQLEDLDTARITAFLSYLENERGNSVRTRKRAADRNPFVLPLRSTQGPGVLGAAHSKHEPQRAPQLLGVPLRRHRAPRGDVL